MAISKMWPLVLFMVSLAETTGSAHHTCNTDVIDAIAGKTVIIGTWSLNNATLSITVKREQTIRFSYFFNGNDAKLASDREGRLILKADNGTTDVSLMFENVSREDEGEYGMEIFFKIGLNDVYRTENAKYKLQLNVIEEAEITYGFDGDNMVTELETTTEYFFLYRYEKVIANVNKSGCRRSEKSTVYGRVRCGSKNDSYTISINNVTQRDTGLYKIQDPMNNSSIHRWFFNISDKPTHAKTGDNVVIGWFYTQPGIDCIIRVIHPYEGAMMLVPSNNVPQINSNVRHRLLYRGDVSRNYMSFKLLNVIASDAGFYRIESLYGTIMPGRKQLIVEASIITWRLNTESIDTNVPDVLLQYDSCAIPKSEKDSNGVVQESSTELHISTSTSPSSTTASVPWDIPVFGMAVVIGVVVVVLFTLGCLIRIQHKNTHRLESVQRFVLEKFDAASFASPSTIRRHLPTPPTPVGRSVDWFQDPDSDQTGRIGLHYAVIPLNQRRVYKECSGINSLETMEYDRPRIVFNTISQTYYEGNEALLEEHLFSAGNAEHNFIDDWHIQREKEPNTRAQDFQAEVKKLSFASETKRTWNPPGNVMSGTSEESGYEMVDGVINITSEDANKISDGRDTLMLNTKGPKEEMMTSNVECNDYDDITLQ